MENDLPNLVIGTIFKSPSRFPTNLTGPSTIGLRNKFLLSLYTAIVPLLLHIAILYWSPLTIMDSRKNPDIPCAIIESLSISPILKPPSFALPPTVCLVNTDLGPFAL